ncbi:MAG: TylF/MycF/NovP-related O-methyltransferase [Planctomycetota bacterium]|jgi:hypothetical protein
MRWFNRLVAGVARRFGVQLSRIRTPEAQLRAAIGDITAEEMALLESVRPFTLTSVERRWALLQAVHHVHQRGVPGDVVECGVWRGGSIILAAKVAEAHYPGDPRDYWCFDTFAGMAEPTAEDEWIDPARAESPGGVRAAWASRRAGDHNDWAYCPVDVVRANVAQHTGAVDRTHFVAGKVEDTLTDGRDLPERISILRLDTDWYASTKAELEVLFPRLSAGGVLIVDDYGCFRGAKQAVDEYFAGKPVWLQRVDYTCRLAIKGATC